MTELAPLAQSYAVVNTQGPQIGQPPALVLGVEPFTTDTGQFTTFHYSSDSEAAVVFSGGKGVITTPSGFSSSMQQYNLHDVQCPQQFFSIDVTSVVRDPGAGYLVLQVGLFYNGDHTFTFGVDLDSSLNILGTSINALMAGTIHPLASTGAIAGTIQKLGFMMCGNLCSGWIDRGSGWEVVSLGQAGGYTDLTLLIPPVTGWKPGFAVWSDQADSVITVDNLTWGLGGGANLRDNNLVTYKDGTPYEPSPGVAMFTANLQGSYIGLFTLDTATYEIEQLGVILVDRIANKWVNDVNCHICLDPDDNTAKVLTTTWYNGFGGSVQVQKTDLADWSILSDALTVLTPTTITLPGQLSGSYGTYDAMLAWDGAKWLIAYTITQNTSFPGDPFYPALASTTDFSSFTLIGADTALAGQGFEGTKIYKVNDAFFITAGGPVSGSRNARVYDEAFSYLGNLDATFVSGTTIPPHAMPWAMGDSFWLITFTGDLVAGTAFTQGNFVLQQSDRFTTTTVPDVVGETQADAVYDIDAADLVVGDITTAFDDVVPAGVVISQSPAGGSSVSSESEVDIVVSLGPEPSPVEDVNIPIAGFDDEAVYSGYLGARLRGKVVACPGNRVSVTKPKC